MKKSIFIIIVILTTLFFEIAAPANSPQPRDTIRASAFEYDASMPVIHAKHFIYDPSAAKLRGSAFQN